MLNTTKSSQESLKPLFKRRCRHHLPTRSNHNIYIYSRDSSCPKHISFNGYSIAVAALQLHCTAVP
eukprot:scaffold445654_cov52-Prasinocladus_malaysianus.AAC.1